MSFIKNVLKNYKRNREIIKRARKIDEYRKSWEKGRDETEKNFFLDKAEEEFNAILALDPDNQPILLRNRGCFFIHARREFERGKADLLKIDLSDPRTIQILKKGGLDVKDIYENLQIVEYVLGNYDESARYVFKWKFGSVPPEILESPGHLAFMKALQHAGLADREVDKKNFEEAIRLKKRELNEIHAFLQILEYEPNLLKSRFLKELKVKEKTRIQEYISDVKKSLEEAEALLPTINKRSSQRKIYKIIKMEL